MNKQTITDTLGQIYRRGRTFLDSRTNTLYFDWTLSGFELDFRGYLLIGNFTVIPGVRPEKEPDPDHPMQQRTVEVKDWPWIAVFLDGSDEPCIEQPLSREQESIVLFEGNDDAVHHIRVAKITEGRVSFVGITGFYSDGFITLPEWEPQKRVQFIGDSITCGFGNRSGEEYRDFHAADENGWMGYAPQTARALGMEEEMICVSGITLARPKVPVPVPYAMNEIYDYTDLPLQDRLGEKSPEVWNADLRRPDLIVVNLGTNDSTMIQFSQDPAGEEKKFRQDYLDFLHVLRKKNGPDAQIVCALGSIDYYFFDDIREAVRQFREETGDEKISCFKFSKMIPLSDDVGSCFHPTIRKHTKMAEELTSFLRTMGF